MPIITIVWNNLHGGVVSGLGLIAMYIAGALLEKRPWKKFAGVISNTHFGDETTKEDIINGYNKLKKACEIINLPIVAIGVDEKLALDFDTKYDNVDVWIYKRMMPKAFW